MIAELRSDVVKKRDFDSTYKDKSGRLELEVARLTTQLEELENMLRSSDDRRNKAESELQAKEKDLSIRDKEIIRLKGLLQGVKSDLEKMTEERDQLIEVSGNLRGELNLMRSSVVADSRGSGEGFRRTLGLGPYTQPMEEEEESSIPKYDRFEDISVSPPVKDSHLSTLKRKISQVKTELDQNFDLSQAKPRSRLFARLEDTPVSSLANTQSFEERE